MRNIKKIVYQVLFILILVILAHKFYQSYISLPRNDFGFSEFLINYEGGFVRRGFLGQIFLVVYNYFHIHPYYSILAVSFVSFFAVVGFFILKFREKGFSYFILPLIFLFGSPIINGFWLRKDMLVVLLFIGCLYLVKRKSIFNFILLNVLLITGILTHESIAFFSLPILFLILVNQSEKLGLKALSLSFFKILPSILAFASVLLHRGSLEVSQKIWASWKVVDFPFKLSAENNDLPTAIEALSWSLSRGIDETKRYIFFNFKDEIWAPLIWAIIILLTYFILINLENFKKIYSIKQTVFNKITFSNVLIVQLLAVSPLFVLGCDYSRWIFFWVASSLATILIIPEKLLVFPKVLSNLSENALKKLNAVLNEKNVVLYSLLLGIPGVVWNIANYVKSTYIYLILEYISKIFGFLSRFFQ